MSLQENYIHVYVRFLIKFCFFPQPEPIELGSRRSRSKRRRTPSPPVAELRGSSKRKKTATTRRIPPRIRDDDQGSGVGGGGEEGEGEGGAVEEDVTKEMPNPAPLPKVEEVPLQSLSREGQRGKKDKGKEGLHSPAIVSIRMPGCPVLPLTSRLLKVRKLRTPFSSNSSRKHTLKYNSPPHFY